MGSFQIIFNACTPSPITSRWWVWFIQRTKYCLTPCSLPHHFTLSSGLLLCPISPAANHPSWTQGCIFKMQIWASQSPWYLSAEGQILTRAENILILHHCLMFSLNSIHWKPFAFPWTDMLLSHSSIISCTLFSMPHCPIILLSHPLGLDFLPLWTLSFSNRPDGAVLYPLCSTVL